MKTNRIMSSRAMPGKMMPRKIVQYAALLIGAGIALSGCGSDRSGNGIRNNPTSDYARVDRMGQPAVATALIPSGQKDDFNQADPTADADFLDEYVATLIFVNNALEDDVTGAGLTSCASDTAGNIDVDADIANCAAVAAPVLSPDVITINTATATSWPNGRGLDDQVVDRILAAALVDVGMHGLDILASLPLNPAANDARADVMVSTSFPYLRLPITP